MTKEWQRQAQRKTSGDRTKRSREPPESRKKQSEVGISAPLNPLVYERPVMVHHGISNETFQGMKKDLKELGGGKYYRIEKSTERGMPSYAHVYTHNKDGWTETKFPTEKDGSIPEEVLAVRLLDVWDGSRERGAKRNPAVDLSSAASEKWEKVDKKGVYVWYLHPNESDVKGIDDPGANLATVLEKGDARLVLMGGSRDKREEFAKVLKTSFTARELKLVSERCIIRIDDANSLNASGYYRRARDSEGKQIGPDEIVVDPNDKDDQTVIIHEVIHLLRARDTDRKGAMRRPSEMLSDQDRDMEEALTEAETVSREKPLTKHSTAGAGYYSQVPGGKKMALEDRKTINEVPSGTDPIQASKRGKKSINAVHENFPETHISKLAMHSGQEAVDQFFEIEKKNGQVVAIHTYSKPGKDEGKMLAADPSNAKVTESVDGKRRRIK